MVNPLLCRGKLLKNNNLSESSSLLSYIVWPAKAHYSGFRHVGDSRFPATFQHIPNNRIFSEFLLGLSAL